MSTAKKTVSNEYIYGYALSIEGEFYSEANGDTAELGECDIYTENDLEAAEKKAKKDMGIKPTRVAIVIREL